MKKILLSLLVALISIPALSQSMSRIDVLYYPNGDFNNAPISYPESKSPFHGIIYDTLRTDSIYTIELYGIDIESGNRFAWGVPYGIQPTGTHYWLFDTYVHQPELSDSLMSLKSWTLGKGYITNSTLADSTNALRDAIANIELLEGPQGPKGDKGDTGEQGIQGPKGDKGDKGDSGIVTLTTTGTGAATYNSETKTLNIPTPALVAQYGTIYTKEWNGKATTGTGTNEYTFNISAAGFSSISNIQVSGYYNGATTTTAPLVAVKTYSTTSVTVVVAESANTGVLLGGNIEGLTDFLKNNGEIFITVKGN